MFWPFAKHGDTSADISGMATLCRTCGQQAEHSKGLFDKEGNDALCNIHKLTGIWFGDHPGVPTKICLSCLLDLNDAVAFRERCIKTNISWFEDQDKPDDSSTDTADEKETIKKKARIVIVPYPKNVVPVVLPYKGLKQATIPPQRSKDLVKIPPKPLDDPVCPEDPSAEPVDPLRCEDPIYVKNEPLSDEEPEDCRKQKLKEFDEDEGEIQEEQLEDEVEETQEDHDSSTGSTFHLRDGEKNSLGKSKDSTIILSKNSKNQEKTIPNAIKGKRKRYKGTKIFICDHCGKKFKDTGNLNMHLLRHTGVKPFECPECGQKELNKYILNIHIRVKHRGEKPYPCKYCDAHFESTTKRIRHVRRTHESKRIKPYKCSYCDKRFDLKSIRTKHEMVHTGERNFP
ncbi:transcription factor Ouib isoform X3 [Drosophila suzukii]